MEVVKLFDKKKTPADWEYDGEADTLYIILALESLAQPSEWMWEKGSWFGMTRKPKKSWA